MEEVPEKSRWQRCGPPPRPTKLLLTHPFLLLSARVFQCCPIGRWRKTSVSFALHVCCVFLISCPVCCSRSPAVHTNTCPFLDGRSLSQVTRVWIFSLQTVFFQHRSFAIFVLHRGIKELKSIDDYPRSSIIHSCKSDFHHKDSNW